MFLDRELAMKSAKARLKKQAELINGCGEYMNQIGYKIDIDTLTDIKDKITTQKFYKVKPSDFMPIKVGRSAFMDQQLTYKDYSIGEDFEAGIIENGSNAQRLSQVDAQIEGILTPIKPWAKRLEYNLFELANASKSGNWSLIEAKERSRVKNWQLGIQKTAFLGLASDSTITGLLNNASVNSNTAIITADISGLSAANFSTFVKSILAAYYSNSASTTLPNTFLMPTDDYLGLGVPVSSSFPNVSQLDYLTKTFKQMTGNENFEIKPLTYCQQEQNSLTLNRYVLYVRDDEETMVMDLPVDYTTTVQDTINGFEYQSVAYGQFTGCNIYRPKEVLYFDYAN